MYTYIYNKEYDSLSWRGMEDVLAKTGIFIREKYS